jgi:hypothetical protein
VKKKARENLWLFSSLSAYLSIDLMEAANQAGLRSGSAIQRLDVQTPF